MGNGSPDSSFGSAAVADPSSQAASWRTFAEQCAQDLRFSFSGMRRNPLFAISIVATLTLGITAVTTVSSIVDAVLLRPTSFLNPKSMIQLEQWHEGHGWS